MGITNKESVADNFLFFRSFLNFQKYTLAGLVERYSVLISNLDYEGNVSSR